MHYEEFLNQIREQLNVILTENLRKNLDEEYNRYKEGNNSSKAFIIRRMIDSYNKAIEKVCYRYSNVQNGIKNNYVPKNDISYNIDIEEMFDNESTSMSDKSNSLSDPFSTAEIRNVKIRDMGTELLLCVSSVFKFKMSNKNQSDNLKEKSNENPIDKYDPKNEANKSLTEFIIICVDKNFRFAMKNKNSQYLLKKSKTVSHTYSILNELASREIFDSKYADKMNRLKDMLTIDGYLRIFEKKAYNYSDQILDLICDIIRLKYTERNTKLDAVKLRRELSLYEIEKKSIQTGNSVQNSENPDYMIQIETVDPETEKIYNNSDIWLLMDNIVENEQKNANPRAFILSGKDVFFFHAIIQIGCGYNFIDRYPNLCSRKVLDFVVEHLKKGEKPTQEMLAQEFFNVTPAAVSKSYKKFLNSVNEKIQESN